jgi:hypothetical protein
VRDPRHEPFHDVRLLVFPEFAHGATGTTASLATNNGISLA